jgi:hypothetical protein
MNFSGVIILYVDPPAGSGLGVVITTAALNVIGCRMNE